MRGRKKKARSPVWPGANSRTGYEISKEVKNGNDIHEEAHNTGLPS